MKDNHDKPAGIAIDKGVPMPKPAASPGREPTYPFRKMNVGDSFFLPGKDNYTFRAHTAYARRHSVKFSARAVIENGVKGVRVWRVE